jgi:hypothetical protein
MRSHSFGSAYKGNCRVCPFLTVLNSAMAWFQSRNHASSQSSIRIIDWLPFPALLLEKFLRRVPKEVLALWWSEK